MDAQHELLREQVIEALDKVLAAAGLRVSRLQLGRDIADVGGLEAQLVQSAAQAEVVHVIGAPGWFDAAKWDAFNVRRERIATNARARLVSGSMPKRLRWPRRARLTCGLGEAVFMSLISS